MIVTWDENRQPIVGEAAERRLLKRVETAERKYDDLVERLREICALNTPFQYRYEAPGFKNMADGDLVTTGRAMNLHQALTELKADLFDETAEGETPDWME
jgi:hypothetical protein